MKLTEADFKAFVDRMQKGLNGLMADFPEATRARIKPIHDELSAQLSKFTLPLPAEEGSEKGLELVGTAFARFQEMAGSFMTNLQKLGGELNGATTALHALQQRVETKELLPKAEVEEMVKLGRDAERQGLIPTVRAMRKQALETAGLPVPAEAILDLPDGEFTALQATGKANAEELARLGIDKGKKIFERCIFLPKDQFAREMDSLREIGVLGGEMDPLKGNRGKTEDRKPAFAF